MISRSICCEKLLYRINDPAALLQLLPEWIDVLSRPGHLGFRRSLRQFFCGLSGGRPLPHHHKVLNFSDLEARDHTDRPCQSTRTRFFNDLQHRGDCLNTRKTGKNAGFVGWVVGWKWAPPECPSILSTMALKDILAQLDAEIARLQQAKTLLAPSAASTAPSPRRGRPKKDTAFPAPAKSAKKKRNLSPEGRARIAEAVRRRWATQKSKPKTKA